MSNYNVGKGPFEVIQEQIYFSTVVMVSHCTVFRKYLNFDGQ